MGVAPGLAVPSGVRRNVLRLTRWTVVGALWVILGVSALPVLVVFVALDRLGGIGAGTGPSPPVGPFNIWEQLLARIEQAIESYTYIAFFRDSVLVSDDGVVIRVRVRSSDAGEWIATHHADALREALTVIGRADAGVEFVSGAFRVRI